MGEVVDLSAYKRNKRIAPLDRQIIDDLLKNNATGRDIVFLSNRFYELNGRVLASQQDAAVMEYLLNGIKERQEGLATDSTLLLDTLQLHLQFIATADFVTPAQQEGN